MEKKYDNRILDPDGLNSAGIFNVPAEQRVPDVVLQTIFEYADHVNLLAAFTKR